MPRWIIAQDAPGNPEYTHWSLIDQVHHGVMGHLLGQTFAQSIADALNETENSHDD